MYTSWWLFLTLHCVAGYMLVIQKVSWPIRAQQHFIMCISWPITDDHPPWTGAVSRWGWVATWSRLGTAHSGHHSRHGQVRGEIRSPGQASGLHHLWQPSSPSYVPHSRSLKGKHSKQSPLIKWLSSARPTLSRSVRDTCWVWRKVWFQIITTIAQGLSCSTW